MKIKVLLIVILLFLSSCASPTLTATPKGNYDYFKIDGMTCLKYVEYRESGLTCNWSQWNGQTSAIIKEIEKPR